MKRVQAALALALLGAISALCLKGIQKIGDLLEQRTRNTAGMIEPQRSAERLPLRGEVFSGRCVFRCCRGARRASGF